MSHFKWFFSFFIIISIFQSSLIWGQDQKLADSLIKLYESKSYEGNKLDLLQYIIQEETKPDKKLKYANLFIREASLDSLNADLYNGYLQKGNALHLIGHFDLALASYFESIRLAELHNLKRAKGLATIAVADIYSEIGNSTNADIYYKNGIKILRVTSSPIDLASALLNAGDEALNAEDYDLALNYFEESSLLFKDADYLIGTAYNLGNIGMVYAELGKDQLAETSINKAIGHLEELEDYYGISVYLTYMSDIYLRRNDIVVALQYAERGLDLSTRHGLNNQISEANLQLSELHEKNEEYKRSYLYYKAHIVFRDSVKNIEVVEQMADQRTTFEVSQKQVEVDLLETEKRNQLIISGFIGLLLVASLWFYRTISKEKKKSEKLLLNILPEDTAKELKATGVVKAKKYEAVTVLFTDFKGFTSYSEKLSPEVLVETIGFYFSKFDAIIEKHGLEKIKTIGDAYMCAGGMHGDTKDHAYNMVQAAFEIAEFVEETKKDEAASELTFDIRIGINSGPVVAGVVGTKKFAYDIWGDTVNVASRMESMSEPGRINISEHTYALVAKDFDCVPRGAIQVKNRGMMQMYFVNALKNQTSKTPSVSK